MEVHRLELAEKLSSCAIESVEMLPPLDGNKSWMRVSDVELQAKWQAGVFEAERIEYESIIEDRKDRIDWPNPNPNPNPNWRIERIE